MGMFAANKEIYVVELELHRSPVFQYSIESNPWRRRINEPPPNNNSSGNKAHAI